MSSFKKLNELVVGENYEGRLVLTESTIRKTRGNPPRPYLSCTFADSSGNIQGNIWNWDYPEPLATGMVYDVEAQVGEYQGKKQFNNITCRASEDQNMYEFSLQYASHTVIATAEDCICGYIKGIANEALQAFVKELYTDIQGEWAAATSAVGVHHVGRGGNLIHTWEVMLLADALANIACEICYDVNRDLVIAGAILHDLGKLDTYVVDGPACYMTTEGVMHDHIVLGLRRLMASKAYKKYPAAGNLLMHIIESHHGKVEYGCPVSPRFIEAEIVARADGLSASLDIYEHALRKADDERKSGDLTDRVYVVDNSQLIRRGYITRALYANDKGADHGQY